MFEFICGIFIGIFIGQTFNVPNIQNCIVKIIENLDHYKKK